MRTRRNPPPATPLLPLGGLHNSDLLSNHWLEHRLSLEPEWHDFRTESDAALASLTTLWQQQRSRVEQYGDEHGLEEAFIQPVLRALGWKLKYQTWLQGREPDYALFLDDPPLDAALKAGRQAPEFWHHPAILADAKAWHVNLDRPTRVGNQREYPPEQIEWYLDRSRLPYAILTNGRLWRLIPRQLAPGKARFQTYLEADIPRLLDARVGGNGRQLTLEQEQATAEEFLRFYLFFSPRAFQPIAGRTPLVERALHGSSEYALSVGEGLKGRVFDALQLCIEGFLTHKPNSLDPARDLAICREQSFVLLYRLLFIMYAEDRGLLPYRRNRLYTENRSLARRRDEIADTLNRIEEGRESDYPAAQTPIWDELVSLFDLIDHGQPRYDVPPYNGGLFDPDKHEFLAQKALPDRYLARVIDHLGRAQDPQHRERGLFRVDYRDLAIQHLGSIYEGLLELRPRFATEPMVVIRERGTGRAPERTIPQRERVPTGWEPTNVRYQPGGVFLETDKGERRATGSYYTPDHIVAYIVDNTLGPLCRDISEKLTAEIAAAEDQYKRARGPNREALAVKLEQLRGEYDDRVLKLRVLDPAMGSGHFLVRACQYLAEEIATNPHTSDLEADRHSGDEPTLTYWKRRVVESCIFGVDLNPMAVELAKLALWLETVSKDAPLSFLDHHLRPGNSLVGARVAELGALPGAMELQQNVFKQQVEQRLPILLEPLNKIRVLPSESMDQIKEKDRLYRKSFQPVCDMFRAVADLWCSVFFAQSEPRSVGLRDVAADPRVGRSAGPPSPPSRPSDPAAEATRHDVASAPRGRRRTQSATAPPTGGITPEQYSEALQALQTDAAFRKLTKQPWFAAAVAPVRGATVTPFHWELQFPEVFFDLTGRRAEAGFDAIIGNPPYGVVSDDGQGAFLRRQYRTPANSLDNFIVFMERASELLCSTGALGMIVPSGWVSTSSAKPLREFFLSRFRPTSFVSLPFDVFESAYIDTVIVTARCSGPDAGIAEDSLNLIVFPRRYRVSSASEYERYSKRGRVGSWTGRPGLEFLITCSDQEGNLLNRLASQPRCVGDYVRIMRGIEVFDPIGSRAGLERPTQAFSGVLQRYTIRPGPPAFIAYPHEIERSKPREFFFSERILVRQVLSRRLRLQAAHTTEPFLTSQSVQSLIHTDPRSGIALPYLLAIINSRLISWYFVQLNSVARRDDFPKIIIKQTRELPLPDFDRDDEAKRRAHDSLTAAALRAQALNDALASAGSEDARRDVQRQLEETDREIDALVYRLFGVSPDEISIVESTTPLGS